jgi:Tetratricopeptide repeat
MVPDRPGWLSNLGNALQARYERTGALADLERSITAKREALNATPVDHPDRVGWLSTSVIRFDPGVSGPARSEI